MSDGMTIPNGWIKERLCKLIRPRGDKILPSTCPHLTFLGMDDVEAHSTKIIGGVPASKMKSSAARFYKGDVLYGRLRPYLNKVAQPSFDGLASAEFMVFPDSELLRSPFLKYRLNAADFVSFASHLNEGDRPRVAFDQIGAFEILLPPSREQLRIVAKLEELFSELDTGVEALTTAQEQLKAYRQSILKYAFSGELSAQWRHDNLASLRNKRELKTLLENARRNASEKQQRARIKPPSEFDKTEIPKHPPEWAIVSMDSLCHHITSGSRDWSQFYNRGSSVFVMAQNIRPGYYDDSAVQYVEPPQQNLETERTRIQYDDILVTIVGANTGDVCRFPFKSDRHYVCQSVALMRLACPAYARFIELYFQSEGGGQGQYARYIYGAGRPHLSFEQLRQTVVPIPDPAEAAYIVNTLDAVFDQIIPTETILRNELLRAEALRQSVLSAAFAGDIVAQDPNDEPASVLLERIHSYREGRIAKKPPPNRKNGKKKAAA